MKCSAWVTYAYQADKPLSIVLLMAEQESSLSTAFRCRDELLVLPLHCFQIGPDELWPIGINPGRIGAHNPRFLLGGPCGVSMKYYYIL